MNSLTKELVNLGQEKFFKAGERIFRIGEPVRHIHELLSGQIKMIRNLADGAEPIIHVINPGEIVAEASLFSERYHCDAIAATDSTIITFPRSDVIDKLNHSPAFALHYINMLSKQVQKLRLVTELRSIRSASDRILNYLHIEADADGSVILNTSLKDLANRLGMTHETLYRELRKLEDSGQIVRQNNSINICR